MNPQKTMIISVVVTIIAMSLLMGYLGYLGFFDAGEYRLWCFDKEGNVEYFDYQGLSENDINPISICNQLMFNPTNYTIEVLT